MNSYLDKGFFLLLLFGMYYLIYQGNMPTSWQPFFTGAFAMILVGLIIEWYRK